MKETNKEQNEELSIGVENKDSLEMPILEKKRCGIINEFLWTCAGVNKQVLRQCPSDFAKYAGIGGTILFTALMAAFSGGYALNFVFENKYIAIAFGVFWGLLIFNLDRFIVNTMYSDGKHTISWAEIKSGLPRIIMAIFLGIVISTPLELKIFYKEIDARMRVNMKTKVSEYVREDKIELDSLRGKREELNESPLDVKGGGGAIDIKIRQLLDTKNQLETDYKGNNNRIKQLTTQIYNLNVLHNHNDSIKALKLQNQRQELRNNNKEINGQIQKINDNLEANSKDYKTIIEKARIQREKEIEDYDNRINILQDKINNAENSYGDRLKDNFGGLREQMKAFSDLRKEDASTDIAAWFIMLLFVIIETAPTFFKMMMEDGSYDELLNAEKHRVKVLSLKRISDINDEINTSVKISTMRNQKRLEAEQIANKDLLEQIAMTQSELLQEAIKRWREEELKKIEQNPSSYLVVQTQKEVEE